jgi:hypothetical protein
MLEGKKLRGEEALKRWGMDLTQSRKAAQRRKGNTEWGFEQEVTLKK